MRKIIYFLCIMFCAVSIKAISPEVDYQDKIYSNRIGDKLYSGQLGYMYMDGNIVYCLDPFQIVGNDYSEDTNYLNKYDSDIIEYFELVSYYGYNKTNKNNIYYYMAAQELIWEKILGGDYVYWSTEKDGNGELINIDIYKNDIINEVNKFYLKPSFDDKHFSLPFFDEIKIYDSNKVFNTYTEFGYSGNNKIIKNDKGFIVSILEEGYQEINYSKTLKTDNITKVYIQEGNQTLASFGINKKIEGGFSIFGREYYTNLSVVFYDNVTKDVISDVLFEMESTNELNGDWNNIDGIYYYNSPLKEGRYKINVIDTYEIVDNSSFEVNKNDLQKDTIVEIYLNRKDSLKNEVIDSKEEIKNDNLFDFDNIDKEEKEDNMYDDNMEEVKDNIYQENINDIIVNDKQELVTEENNIIYNKIISSKSELIELPNTCNYNLEKYILLFIVFLIGTILYEKEIRN